MMNRYRTTAFALLALTTSGCASSGTTPAPAAVTAPPAAASPTADAASSASFSVAQADRGRDTFRGQCTECHYSSEFSDSQFKFKWSRRTAGSLYQFILTSMPETSPGSLSGEETVELVSYILRMNGFQAGSSELPADRAVLDGITLASLRNQ
jgi:cytochrome c5